MTLAARARRIAVAAAYGGGGLGVLGAATAAILVAEAKLARRWIGPPTTEPPHADGLHGDGPSSEPIRFVMLGDSSAAGVGTHEPGETPAALLASGLAEATGRTVLLRSVARSGAMSADLDAQVSEALVAEPDIAVIMIGANDVTHRVRPSASVRLLDQAVRRLRAAGAEVVVGTCPDLGTVEPVAQPLRYVARQWSRQLAAAQTIVVVEAGGRSVSLGDLLGPEFAKSPAEMFSPDRFHPSPAGYRAAAMALLPSVCAALGCGPEVDDAPDVRRGEGVRTVAEAAAEAADAAGTEVSAIQVAGRDRGPRGRWALLRHRRRRQLPGTEAAGAGAVEVSEPDASDVPVPIGPSGEASTLTLVRE